MNLCCVDRIPPPQTTENITQKRHFPKDRGENKKSWKPAPPGDSSRDLLIP